MRRALDIQHRKHIYDRIAGHYDLRHTFFTAGSDQRGRKIIVEQTVKPFDVVLSTYSLCPLYDPALGAMEIYRVVKPGGLIGICHSSEPASKFTAWLAQKIENVVWLLPYVSLGYRSVSVLPTLEQAGAQVVFKKRIGVPLWPFLIFVVKKAINR